MRRVEPGAVNSVISQKGPGVLNDRGAVLVQQMATSELLQRRASCFPALQVLIHSRFHRPSCQVPSAGFCCRGGGIWT